jgi:hypothetical protein
LEGSPVLSCIQVVDVEATYQHLCWQMIVWTPGRTHTHL